jgi:hypothetical protein
LICTLYYVIELAGFMSEYQFVVFMHILKRTVHNWNSNIEAVSENDDVTNVPLYRNERNRQKSVLFRASNNSVTSKHEKIHSNLMHFKQLRELHVSACDIAESVNAVYSPVLLLSVARSFISLTHILYYIVVSFIVQKSSFFCSFTANNSYFLWLTLNSLRLIWLVYFSAFTAKEVSHKVQHLNFLHNYHSTNVKLPSLLRKCLSCFVLQIVYIFQLQLLYFNVKIQYFTYRWMLHIPLPVIPYRRNVEIYLHTSIFIESQRDKHYGKRLK